MTWIDSEIARLKRQRERHAMIRSEATKVYDALWDELVARITEARNTSYLPGFDTNGSLYDRRIVIPVFPPPGRHSADPKYIEVTLTEDREGITAIGAGLNLLFALDLCPGDIVCIKYNGQKTNIEEAARLVLHPLFFPDLEPDDPASGSKV